MKKSKYSARLKNNHGQAVIEYVLMLIISVSLILMLMTQIFKPMQAFTQSLMGDYMACLLETGELPRLGDDSKSDSECKFSFQNVPGNVKNSSSSSNSNNNNSSSSDSSKNSSSKNKDGSSSSGNGSYAGSNSRPSGSNYITRQRSPTRGAESGNANQGKVVEIALEGGGAGGFYSSSNGNSYAVTGRRVASTPVTGLTAEDRKKLEKKGQTGNKTTAVQNDGFAPPAKKIAVKKPERSIANEAPEEPVTFGNFIRWLFIAALILALLVFLGGQALQFSKSSEK